MVVLQDSDLLSSKHLVKPLGGKWPGFRSYFKNLLQLTSDIAAKIIVPETAVDDEFIESGLIWLVRIETVHFLGHGSLEIRTMRLYSCGCVFADFE